MNHSFILSRALAGLRRYLAGLRSNRGTSSQRLPLILEELETRLTPSNTVIDASSTPIVSVPGLQTQIQNIPILFLQKDSNAITVGDPNIGTGQDTVMVESTTGELFTSGSSPGLSSVVGNGTSLVSFTGTLDALNNALDGLTLQPASGFAGAAFLSATLVPDSGAVTASAGVPLLFVAPPSIGLPASSLTVNDDLSLVFSAATPNLNPPPNNYGPITVVDPNASAGTEVVVFEVTSGTLALGSTATGASLGLPGATLQFSLGSATITGNGTSLVIVTGTQGQVDSAIENVTYTPAALYQGSGFLSVMDYNRAYSFDTAISSIALTIQPGNIPPTIDGPHTQQQAGLLEFTAANGNAITVGAPDAGQGTDTVYVQALAGSLTVNATGLASASGNGTASLVLSGTVTALNLALSNLYYQPLSSSRADAIDILVSDRGNTAGLAKTAALEISLAPNATAVAAPTAAGPGAQTANAAGLTFSQANGNALKVIDGNSAGAVETAYVQVANGTLIANGNSGANVTGNGTSLLVINGTVAQINAALDGLHYTAANNGAADVLDLLVSNATTAGTLTGSLELDITFVNSPTLAPVLTMPGALSGGGAMLTITEAVPAGGVLTFSEAHGNAIHVAAGDANGVTEQIVVQVLNGRLAVGNTTDLTSVVGNGTDSLTLMGTIAAINDALDGLQYAPSPGASADYLSVAFSNNGSQGAASRIAVGGVAIAVGG